MCPRTMSPALKPSSRLSITRPTDSPWSTPPMATGGAYDGPSRSRPRMYGSIDIHRFLTRTSPCFGFGIGDSIRSRSLSFGMPSGRVFRIHCRFTFSGISWGPLRWLRVIPGISVEVLGENSRTPLRRWRWLQFKTLWASSTSCQTRPTSKPTLKH